jgi:hypothetical protein
MRIAFVALFLLWAAPAVAAVPSPPPLSPFNRPSPTPAPARPTFAAFGLAAHEIDFYSARYILTADGSVDLRMDDGTHITGDSFAMDIRLNRFVVAGNVTLTAAGQTYEGAAFADFLDFDRQYFVPIGDAPDRWTYIHADYRHPYFGRLMPGDTFFLPDVSHDRIFLVAHKVVVQPRESIKFVTPTLNFGLAKLPWPSFFLNFTYNPNFAQNSLPGAFVDGPYDMFGGGHTLFTTHIRYDNLNKVFFGYEQHEVSDRHYLVASISPLTRPFKQYNFDAFDHVGNKFDVQGSFQDSAFQHDFHTPLASSAYANLKLTAGLKRSYIQFNSDQFWESLLAQPAPGINGLYYYGDPTHNWVPDHLNQTQLTWASFQNRVFSKIPYLVFSDRVSAGFAHDGYGLFFFGGQVPKTIYNHAVGFNLASPSLTIIPDSSGQHRDVSLNVSFDKQRQWYSLPHHIDTTITSASLSHAFDRHFSVLANYVITNQGDFWGNNQPVVYPSIFTYSSPMTGDVYPSWSAFDGFTSQRSYIGQLLYTPSTAVVASLQFRHNKDFPEPIPGLAPPPNVFAWQNYGLAPNQLTVDFRFRLTPILTVDFSDAYYFNFGGYEKWTPNYAVQALR